MGAGTTDVTMAQAVGRGLRFVTLGNLGLRVGNFAVSVLVARLIAPEQFGVFAVALTIWAVLQTLAELGLGADLIRCEDIERRAPTVATLGFLTGALLAAGLLVGAAPLARAFQSPASTGVIQLMAASIVLFGLTTVPAARLARSYRQGSILVVNVLALMASTGAMTTLALMGSGPVALAVGQIVSQLVSVVGLRLAAGTPLRFGYSAAVARESISFALPLAMANLLSWLLLTVDNVIVARVLDPVQLGFYIIAFNISSWPMSAIGQGVRAVALPAFSRLEDARRKDALIEALVLVWAVALLVGAGLAFLARPTIELLYGARWLPSAEALMGLALFGALRVVFDVIATYFVALGRSSLVLAVQVWWLIVMLPAMIIAVGRFGLAGAGWAHLIVAGIAVLPAYLVLLSRAGVPVGRLVRPMLLPTATVVPVAVVCWLSAIWIDRHWLALLAGALSGLVLYAWPLSRWWRGHLRGLSSDAGR